MDAPITHTASRTILAAPRAIFRVLLDGEAMANWRPPAGMTARIEHFDPRPDGRYRMVLIYPDDGTARGKSSAREDVVDGRFIDIFPDERLVEEVQFDSDDPRFQGPMTITTTLLPVRDGTRVTITATNVPAGISEADHRTGMESTLKNLANFVE
ncbi:SRPBCC domain-containing protein [Sphingomonas oryzagri]